MSSISDPLVVAQASVFDFAETVSDTGVARRIPRRIMAHMACQIEGGLAITVRDPAGRLCLMCGLWPESDYVEAWFAAGPALMRSLRPAIRVAVAHCEAAMRAAGESEARAFIHPGSVAGARLAALFGFTAGAIIDHPLGPVQSFARRVHGYGQVDMGHADEV